MKKFVLTIVAISIATMLAGCGSRNEKQPEEDVDTPVVKEQSEEEPTPVKEQPIDVDVTPVEETPTVEPASSDENSISNNEDQSSEASSNNENTDPLIGKVYKNETLDLTFKMQTPDANGNPTEIVLNGVTYFDDITFDNETMLLSNYSITNDNNWFCIKANFTKGDTEVLLDMEGDGEWWRMRGPGFGSGDYYLQ